MRKEVVRNGVSLIPWLADSTVEIDGVPVYDCRRDQAEAGGAEALALEGAVADLALQDCESRFLWEIWCRAIDAQTFVCESRRANALQAKALRDAGCRRIFEDATRREIHESVISGRKTGAEMALLYNVSAPTVSRIVAAWLSVQF